MTLVMAREGDTVDSLCLAGYGRTDAVTEAVLEANPPLRDLGPILPVGTLITLPDQPPAPPAQLDNFWDGGTK